MTWSAFYWWQAALSTRAESDSIKLNADVRACASTAPWNIWLCVSDDEADHDEPFPDNVDGVTWCHEPAASCSIEFIRTDIVDAMIDKATAELHLLVEDLQKELADADHVRVPAGYQIVPDEFIIVLDNAPCLNYANYDHDQVCRLDAAVREALSMLNAAKEGE